MSKQFSIAVSIWVRTLLFNGFVTPFIMFFTFNDASFFSGIFIIVVELIVTSPLLALITPMVKVSVRLPYTSLACKTWLAFMLMLIAALFIWAFGLIFNLNFLKQAWELSIGTLISVLLAVMSLSKSIDNYKKETDASNLV